MHEKTGKFALIGRILDHPKNIDRDAHERHALSQRLATLSFSELQAEFRSLS